MHENLIERYLTDLLEVRGTRSSARALIALQPALDDNYRNVIKATYPWPGDPLL